MADRVYTIGTDNAYPYHYLDEDGKPDGMIGGLIDEAARRSRVRLRWVRAEGPRSVSARQVDFWPLVAASPDVVPAAHFTRPVLLNTYVRLTMTPVFLTPEGARGMRRVAVLRAKLAGRHAQEDCPWCQLSPQTDRVAALEALCTGQVDAAIVEARMAQHLMLRRPAECDGKQVYSVGLDAAPVELAMASVPEAAPAADRIRAEIDRMMADGTVDRMMRRWHYYYSGEAETLYRIERAWTAERIARLSLVGLAAGFILVLLLLVRVRRARLAAVKANASKSQFLANMSHEIRTPMNGVIGMLQLARESETSAELDECLVSARASADALLALLDDVLDLSKLEANRSEIRPAPYQVTAPLTEAIANFKARARQKGIELTWSGGPGVPGWAMGDHHRIRQVLLNLVGNAIKFTEQGSVSVAVTARPLGEDLVELAYTVTDTGIGIDPANLGRIFEPFRQADESMSRKHGGTGLGLAISRNLALRMGGDIFVDSVPGKGSTFRFWMSLKPCAAPANATVRPAVQQRQPASKSLKLLLAEDHPVNQKLAMTHLRRRGHEVELAVNGKEAIEKAQKTKFDAILMDVQMPEMDGLEATRTIRRLEKASGSHVRIVGLTAHALKEDLDVCLDAGMDSYVVKPFQPSVLFHAVEV